MKLVLWVTVSQDVRKAEQLRDKVLTTAAVWDPERLHDLLRIESEPEESAEETARRALARAEAVSKYEMRSASIDEAVRMTKRTSRGR